MIQDRKENFRNISHWNLSPKNSVVDDSFVSLPESRQSVIYLIQERRSYFDTLYPWFRPWKFGFTWRSCHKWSWYLYGPRPDWGSYIKSSLSSDDDCLLRHPWSPCTLRSKCPDRVSSTSPTKSRVGAQKGHRKGSQERLCLPSPKRSSHFFTLWPVVIRLNLPFSNSKSWTHRSLDPLTVYVKDPRRGSTVGDLQECHFLRGSHRQQDPYPCTSMTKVL